MSSTTIGQVERICFVGGGWLMVESAVYAESLGFEVALVVAKRHADEEVCEGVVLSKLMEHHNLCARVSERPEQASAEKIFASSENSLAFCFGPAWIFPEEVLRSYTRGMFNFNGIPVPRYLGGAHHTWQILNQSVESGRVIQKIEKEVDKGDIYMREYSSLDSNPTVPADFFQANAALGIKFVRNFLDRLLKEESFVVSRFASIEEERIYFPRLSTPQNAWIDWSWTGREIESFCNAFSEPYEGASTTFRGGTIRFRRVIFRESRSDDFHPFCFGLVVRVAEERFFVSTRGGLLEVLDWSCEDPGSQISEGERLGSAPQVLHEAHNIFPKTRDFD